MYKVTKFTVKDNEGNRYTWSFWKEEKYWMLKDHTGYVRTLEERWIDSAPRITSIAANHSFTSQLS